MAELSDEQAQAAKDELRAAITAYYELVDPGVYVSDWALITHKESIELQQENATAVSVLVPTGQGFHVTRGLIEIAREAQRNIYRD